MREAAPLAARPIRVVLFGGGPGLQRDVAQFIIRLVDHPDIEFLGAICQSQASGPGAIARDLWRRRGLLAAPLLALHLGRAALRWAAHPSDERDRARRLAQLRDSIHFVRDIHAPAVLERVRALEPDLGLIYGSPILQPELFQIPAQGTLGIHHGKVPEYRGKKTTFWAMFHGEPTAGVTIQHVSAGLDKGDIVREGEVPTSRRSLRSVWQELEQLGFDLYVQAILDLRVGRATRTPQPAARGRLYRDPKPSQIVAFWWRQMHRRLRGPDGS